MVHGIIDIGSNTVRLSVFEYQNKDIKLLLNKKAVVGLATCVRNGGLTEEGIINTCNVLNKFQKILKDSQIDNFSVFATASLRNINNSDYVLNSIFERTGIRPEILFGDEEARLDFIAIKNNFDLNKGIIADIGGGSTEIVLFENAEIKRLDSIPIGALNLQNKAVKEIIADHHSIKKMKKLINKALDELKWDYESDYIDMFAIGGSSRAILKVVKELTGLTDDENSFESNILKTILKKLKSENIEEIKSVYKIIPERIFSFIGGLIILNEIVKKFGCQNITVSKNGLREGYLIEKIISKSYEKSRDLCENKEKI